MRIRRVRRLSASLPASLDRLGYAHSLLERHSAERTGPTPTLAETPDASLLLFCGDVPVLRVKEGGATCLLNPDDVARAGAPALELFLGRVGGRPAFAGALPADAAALYGDDPAFRVLDARAVAVEGAVPAPEMGVLATAKSLLGWHARHGFCAQCGTATTLSCGGYRRDCAACGTEHFPRTDPVVIMLVTNGDRCLLAARRASCRGSIPASPASSNPARPSRTRCGARPSRRPACGSARCATSSPSPGRSRPR